MELTIEQPCPSCGAPINIKESHRLIHCEYCDIKNYRIHQRLPRYALPAKAPVDIDQAEMFYIPYLRFKGSVFLCQGDQVRHKFVDTTRVGGRIKNIPVSLGLRPQAMAVIPVTAKLPGRFVPQTVKAGKIFSEASKLTTLFEKNKKEEVSHQAFIGETISRIYLPVYEKKGRMIDGVVNSLLGAGEINGKTQGILKFDKTWEPRFLATICPDCGGELQAGGNSLVLHCDNCATAWVEEKGRFVRLEYRLVSSSSTEVQYLPFWHLLVEGVGTKLSSFGDLIELTNQPVVLNATHREQPLGFLVPGFKLTPNAFLHAAKNMTLRQPCFQQMSIAESVSRTTRYPATLPYSEAIQALKIILAASAVSVGRVMKLLPELQFRVTGVRLLYVPFRPSNHDWIDDNTGISISSAALRFGRSL